MATNSVTGGGEEHLVNDVKTPINTAGDKGESNEEAKAGSNPVARKRVTLDKHWNERMLDFKEFLWNPARKEFMGRTSKSWTLILVFYVCLYSFLAGMFALCFYGMLSTLSPYTPKYRDRINNPGVMIRPDVGGFSIAFNPADESTWSQYVQNLHQFLAPYNDSIQAINNIPCTPGGYFMRYGNESEERQACQFNRTMLENCSGIEDATFGYSSGKPCILLKMNKIIGYLPGKGVKPYVSCEMMKGNNNVTIHFYPREGAFDLMYFPYYGKLTHVNYSTPLVAMQYQLTEKNSEVRFQCKINGRGIKNNIIQDRYSGRIFFTLNIKEE